MKELEGKDDAASKKSLANLEKKSVKKYKEMKRIERSIKAQAEMSDEQRGVCPCLCNLLKSQLQGQGFGSLSFLQVLHLSMLSEQGLAIRRRSPQGAGSL